MTKHLLNNTYKVYLYTLRNKVTTLYVIYILGFTTMKHLLESVDTLVFLKYNYYQNKQSKHNASRYIDVYIFSIQVVYFCTLFIRTLMNVLFSSGFVFYSCSYKLLKLWKSIRRVRERTTETVQENDFNGKNKKSKPVMFRTKQTHCRH